MPAILHFDVRIGKGKEVETKNYHNQGKNKTLMIGMEVIKSGRTQDKD